ncbi:MAG: hypothetical protein EOP51_17220, partial [Sphingobacteriales bacterium]
MKLLLSLLIAACIGQAALAQKQGTAASSANPTPEYDPQNTYVPGDSVLLIDYFDQEKPGNSPIKWKTSFASPVVEIAGSRHFKLLNNGEYSPRVIR